MSDKELNINIRTTADTSGADQTTTAINKTKEAAQGAGEGAEAIDKTTTALNNSKTGADEATQAINKTKETVQETGDGAQAVDKVTVALNKTKEKAEETSTAINKTREAVQESGESVDALDQVTNALNNAKTAAEETGAALNEDMGPEQERALENARSKLDEYADALTAAGSRMKAAFNENPGLTGFIDEVTNAVLTSEEFRKKLEQVDDVFEVLNDRTSNLDLGAKWGDDLDENLQKILDDYNKEMDAADKAADKVEAAEARKQKTAARTVERLEAGNRRATASYEELQTELETYIAKLEEARKAGDNVAQADALKNIQDLGRRIKAAGDAGEITTGQVKGMAGQITIAATRILGMSSSLRGAIPFIRLFGTTIKTAMGPLGWAMLLIQGLTAGITALIDHFKAKSDELDRQAEQATERMKKRAKDAAESIKKSYEAIQDYNKADRAQEVNKGFEDFIKGITTEYRLQTLEIERQIQLRREEAARQKGIDTQEAELARVQLENKFEDGKITKRQRDYGMMMINQNLDDKIRRLELEVSQKEFMDHGRQLDTAVQNRDKLKEKDFDMKFIQGQMPSLQEVEKLFQQQFKAQERIDKINKELSRISELRENSLWLNVDEQKEFEQKAKEEQRYISDRKAAQEEGNAVTTRINELRDLFHQSGVNFEPSYKQGTDPHSRTGEYQKALEEQNTKAKEIAKNLADAGEEAGRLADIMGSDERSIADQERGIRTQDRLNSGNIDLFNKRADKEEAKEAEMARKKLEKEQEQELKKLQREQQQEANKAIKTLVEGFTLNSGKSATHQQTTIVHKAIDGIRKDIERAAADGNIDPEEIRDLGKLFVGKLTELGIASRQAIQGLTQEFNHNIDTVNKEIEEIKRLQRNQLNRERFKR